MRRFLNFSRDNNIEFYRRNDIVPGVTLGQFNSTVRQRKNTGDYDVFIDFNKYGLRDTSDVSKAKESSLLIVGDSFTFGLGIETGKRFSDLVIYYFQNMKKMFITLRFLVG